jgi:DNA gyrase subunit A
VSDQKKLDLNTAASEDFLNYASAVIKDRAIPNIEDNMKPVHRRIIYTMNVNKLTSDAKHKKSASTVGDVIKIHPHGDSAIYDSLVRLAQPWKMRYPLIDIQGNLGNINGSPAAAMRYTEARLSPFGDLMVREIADKAADFIDTYDNESKEPIVLPSLFPNIICNGNMGIAVGMSSSIMPHNLKEAVDAIIAYLKKPTRTSDYDANPVKEELTVKEILKHLPGPDFPTGGTITNINKIEEIYSTGSGTLDVQGKYHVEDKGKEVHIVFTEVPYMTNIEDIMSKIKTLAAEGGIDDVINIQNNTGRSGLELRVILKPRSNVNKNLQILFDKCGLKNNIRIGMTVLENHRPVQTNMLGLIRGYVNHRHQVIKKIYLHKREKAQDRLHIIEGLIVAVQDIDNIIILIKESSSRAAAKVSLIDKYNLSEMQADAILDMKLSQLTRMDAVKLQEEKVELENSIAEYNNILARPDRREEMIKESLLEMKEKYGDARRTFLKDLDNEDKPFNETQYTIALFENSEMSITETTQIASASKVRVGKKLFNKKPLQVIQFSNKNKLMAIDIEGRVIIVDGKKLYPEESVYLYDFDNRIKNDVVFISEVSETDMAKEFLTFITKDGLIKKSATSEYGDFKAIVYGLKLKEKDYVIQAAFTNENEYAFIMDKSKLNKFSLSEVRPTGRATQGVKAADMDDQIFAAIGSDTDKFMLYDKDGAAKIVLGQDFALGVRAGRGQVINQNNIGIVKVNKASAILLADDLKGYNLDITDVEIKNSKAANNKIYNGNLFKIGL